MRLRRSCPSREVVLTKANTPRTFNEPSLNKVDDESFLLTCTFYFRRSDRDERGGENRGGPEARGIDRELSVGESVEARFGIDLFTFSPRRIYTIYILHPLPRVYIKPEQKSVGKK
jgi:hypothetical protein